MIVAQNASPVSSRQRITINGLALLYTFIVACPSVFDLSREASAAGIAALVLVPLAALWISRRRLLIGDPIIVLGVVWILAVTAPVYFPSYYKDRMWVELSPWSLDESARWMYRSWSAICLGYWAGRCLFKPPPPRMPSPADLRLQNHLRRWIGIVGIVGAVVYLIVRGGQTSQLTEELAVADSTGMQILHLMRELGYAYIYLHFFDRGRGLIQRVDTWILLATLAIQLATGISSASKYPLMIMGAAWVLANATSPSRPGFLKEATIGICSIAAVVGISYFVAAYRGELIARPAPAAGASISDVIATQIDAVSAAARTVINGEQIKGYYADGYDSSFILDRFAHLSSFAVFMEFIHFETPYENAFASAIAPVFSVIPSALFEDKVHFFHSGDFAIMYGWTHGGLSITTPGSFFWAWGYPGIILGSLGLGWCVAWLWNKSLGWNSSALVYRAVMISAVLGMLDVGVTFQMVVIPATRVLILVLLIRAFLTIHLTGERHHVRT